jgi:hypothetical protein
VRVTWLAGVGGVGVVVGVGGVEGRSIWGSVTGSEKPKIREKKNILKIRNNISEQRKNTLLYWKLIVLVEKTDFV